MCPIATTKNVTTAEIPQSELPTNITSTDQGMPRPQDSVAASAVKALSTESNAVASAIKALSEEPVAEAATLSKAERRAKFMEELGHEDLTLLMGNTPLTTTRVQNKAKGVPQETLIRATSCRGLNVAEIEKGLE